MVMLKMRTGRRRSSTAVAIGTVAEQAGVSMMTVSNVINGTGKVSDDLQPGCRFLLAKEYADVWFDAALLTA
jgi:hypothetical protein